MNMENNNNNSSKKSDFTSASNQKPSIQLGKNVTASNDSGIHEDGLDSHSQTDVIPTMRKVTRDEFKLPAWLANGEPIPDELLAKRAFPSHAQHPHSDNDDDDDEDEDEMDPYQSSSFYGFSFIELSGSSEDTWSVRSSNTAAILNTNIRDEIKTCVETLHTCLDQFREMNEQYAQTKNDESETNEIIDESIVQLMSDLIDRVESAPAEDQQETSKDLTDLSALTNILLDYNLLNELFTKKLTFQEYLVLLDRLIDNNILQLSSKTADELSTEILSLAEDIEHYRTMINTDQHHDLDQNSLHLSIDNQYQQQFLSNTQSNYSVISFLQQSTSMDMSLLITNDFASQIQSTLVTSTIQQQQTSTSGGRAADVGTSLLQCDSCSPLSIQVHFFAQYLLN